MTSESLLAEECICNGKCQDDIDKNYVHCITCTRLNDFLAGLKVSRRKEEWHYPSKGELPKCDEETQLIFYVNCYYEIDGETLVRKRMVLGYYKKAFLRDDEKLFVEKSKGYEEEHLPKDVIAWKEIVLPELEESETNG